MDEERIVVGAQVLGFALKALAAILLAALVGVVLWLWRHV